MASLVINNGRVVTPEGVIYGGVAVEDGIITHVGSDSSLPQGKRVIDAQGHFVIPGLIDPHVHMGAGFLGTAEERLTTQFAQETDGAIHGGVTTLGHFLSATMGTPLLPSLDMTIRVGEQRSYIDFFCHACVVDDGHLAEQPELCRRGVTSFKHFFNAYKGREGMGKYAPCDEGMLFRSFEFLAKYGYPAVGMVHCEEMDIIYVLLDRLQAAGRNDCKAWTEGRPAFVEYMRMVHAFEIAKATGATLYCVHISCAEGVDLVAEVRRQGYRFYGETCPAYLTHTCEMEEQIGCWGKVNTTLKYARDNERLWRGILDGGISCIATDHAGYSREAKEQGGGKHNNIWKSWPGLCGGMEHMLPVMMTFGVNAGRISIEDMVKVCSTNTAKIFGLYPRKGVLSPGADADIVIVDPEKEAIVDDKFYHCRSEFSIYEGWKFKGMARTTIVRGQVMMEDYQTVGKSGTGRYLPCRAC